MHVIDITVKEYASRCGLFVSTWSPGDGMTRYRFMATEKQYHADDGICTCLGRKEALTWLDGYYKGKTGRIA